MSRRWITPLEVSETARSSIKRGSTTESAPLVSVIIPCRNAERTIKEAIESVLSQSYPEIETIVIDDGSQDNSLKIIRSFHANVRWFSQHHSGACAARNVGLLCASGKYVQFLDADDVLLSNKIEQQVRILEEAGTGFLAGSFVRESLDGLESGTVMVEEGDPWTALLKAGGRLGITSSNLWSLQALRSVGGWNVESQASQETELMFRLLSQGFEMAWDTCPRTLVRPQENSISNSPGIACKPAAWRCWVSIREEAMEYLLSTKRLTTEHVCTFQQTMIRLARLYRSHDPQEVSDMLERNSRYMKRLRLASGYRVYGMLYNMTGFSCAERCRKLYGRIRPGAWSG